MCTCLYPNIHSLPANSCMRALKLIHYEGSSVGLLQARAHKIEFSMSLLTLKWLALHAVVVREPFLTRCWCFRFCHGSTVNDLSTARCEAVKRRAALGSLHGSAASSSSILPHLPFPLSPPPPSPKPHASRERQSETRKRQPRRERSNPGSQVSTPSPAKPRPSAD